MKLSPWEADCRSASQEIPHLLRDQIIQCGVWKSPPLAPNLSQINPVHTRPPCFPTSHFIIILHMHLGLPSCLFPSGLPNKVPISHFSYAFHMPRSFHPTRFDHRNDNNWWRVYITKLLIIQSSPASRYFLLCQIQIFSSAPWICVLLSLWQIKWHTHTKQVTRGFVYWIGIWKTTPWLRNTAQPRWRVVWTEVKYDRFRHHIDVNSQLHAPTSLLLTYLPLFDQHTGHRDSSVSEVTKSVF